MMTLIPCLNESESLAYRKFVAFFFYDVLIGVHWLLYISFTHLSMHMEIWLCSLYVFLPCMLLSGRNIFTFLLFLSWFVLWFLWNVLQYIRCVWKRFLLRFQCYFFGCCCCFFVIKENEKLEYKYFLLDYSSLEPVACFTWIIIHNNLYKGHNWAFFKRERKRELEQHRNQNQMVHRQTFTHITHFYIEKWIQTLNEKWKMKKK